MLRWLIGIILGEIICESSNWQHVQRLKITILGANWQFFRLERIAKCLYFILSTQNIKFYWFVMKIKKFLLPIWWYNRGLFLLGNKYFGVFVLNGLTLPEEQISQIQRRTCSACSQFATPSSDQRAERLGKNLAAAPVLPPHTGKILAMPLVIAWASIRTRPWGGGGGGGRHIFL